MPAAGLADVGMRDANPLVLGGRRQHLPQPLAIPRLQLGSLPQRKARRGDPCRQCVAHLLELLEAGDARLGEGGGNRGIDCDTRKGVGGEAGELVLKAADLAPQLGARQALVASHLKRRQRHPIEQIRHRIRV